MRKVLLFCGLASSLLYTAANIFVPARFEGYDWISQTVSELSAIGAPTRTLWTALIVPYGFLLIAFGWGVILSSQGRLSLKIAGGLMIVHGVIGFFWPPMHLRGAEFSLTDTLHIVFTLVTIPLMILQIVFGAAAFGKRFRIFSAVTLGILVAFGVLTGLQAPHIATNLPTPMIGVWERINIAAYMTWIAVFAIVLWKEAGTARVAARSQQPAPPSRPHSYAGA
jgi:hypothetical protein